MRSMTNIEIKYIIRPNMEKVAKNALIERFNSILSDNWSKSHRVYEMDSRSLGYEINDYRDGYYVVVTFKGGRDAVNEFDRLAKFSEDIIRHMVISLDEK